jgi:hypothetical protein
MKELIYIHTTSIDSKKANLIQVLFMCNAFIDNGINVILYLPKEKRGKVQIPNDIEIRNKLVLRFYEVNYRIPAIFRYALGIKKYLNEHSKTQFFFIRHFSLTKCLIKREFPFIYESHNFKLHSNYFIDKYYKKYLKKVINKDSFKLFFSISGELNDFWKTFGLPNSKLNYYHDAIDVRMFKNILTKKEALEKLSIVSTERKRIVYAGSLYKDRGIHNIIDLAAFFKELDFIIVGGTDSEISKLQKYLKKKNISNIEFVGRVDHKMVPLYLFSSDIVLAFWSSKVETINYCSPLKVFEYMASERIILAHGFSTIKEVLNNSNAVLIKPDSLEEMKRGLSIALTKLDDKSIAKQARKDVLQKYTWLKRAKFIKDILY